MEGFGGDIGHSASADGPSPTVEPVPVSPVPASVPNALQAVIAEALAFVEQAEKQCPFSAPPYPAANKPCSQCGMGSNGDGGTCTITRGNEKAVKVLRAAQHKEPSNG